RYEFYPFATRDNYGGDGYNPNTGLVTLGGVGGTPHSGGVNVGSGQVGPRVGLAYRLDEKTVIRAGFGISIDPNSFRAERDAYPAIIALSLSGATSFQSPGTLAQGLPAIVGPNLTTGTFPLPTYIAPTTFPATFNRGYVESLNFTVQRGIR